MIATGRQTEWGCVNYYGNRWVFELNWSWERTSFEQTDDHPVVCVSWYDANAYAEWLSSVSGHRYRLLTESEWEYAARSETLTRRYWGDDVDHSEQCKYANAADRTYSAYYSQDSSANIMCDDGYVHTSPVGRFLPNQYGLYDMLGNATQWVSDCIHNHTDFVADAAPEGTRCTMRILRGGSWADPAWGVRAADRYRDFPSTRCMGIGFRVAKDIIR